MPELNTETLCLEVEDPTFIAFMCENTPSKRLELSKQLQKTYKATLVRKKMVVEGQPWITTDRAPEITRTPFELVATMKLLPQIETLLVDVFEKVKALEDYGQIVINTGFEKKGKKTQELAQSIRAQVSMLKDSIISDPNDEYSRFLGKAGNQPKTSQAISSLINNGHKSMGNDRNWSDCIAHLCLALTGIGLLIMIGNKLYSGQFFLNNTSRQVKLGDVKEALHNIDIISKKT
jgi:hypothetical protein